MATQTEPDQRAKALHQALKRCGVTNPRGIELMRSLNASAHIIEALAEQDLQASGLSVPRLRLLMWLHAEELGGSTQGVSPSRLSTFQHISKNTVSSLLKSLEEQGLIERTLSSQDKRKFHIRLSQKGRELVGSTLPHHAKFVTEVFSDLSVDEQSALAKLLNKLRQSLLDRAKASGLASHHQHLAMPNE